MLVLSIIIGINFIGSNKGDYSAGLLLMMLDIAFVAINFILAIIGFIFINRDIGKAFLICAGLMMLIGPATCMGVLGIFSL